MNDFLQSAFDRFHSEVDVILGAPIPFFATIFVIITIEYFLVSALNHDRLAAQREKIRDLTKRVAMAETKMREMMAAAPAPNSASESDLRPDASIFTPRSDAQAIRTVPEDVASVTPETARRELAVETFSDSRVHSAEPESVATEFSAQPSFKTETLPERISPLETIFPATQTSFTASAAAHEYIAQETRDRVAQEALSYEFEAEIERLKNARSQESPSQPTQNTSAPRLDIGILNLDEGSRVGPVVEVEILSAIAMDRLQACVFSARTRQWHPQDPFWKNRGILIATCRFGDENHQAGDSFMLSIIETQKPLNAPAAVLPCDVPQTKAITVYRV